LGSIGGGNSGNWSCGISGVSWSGGRIRDGNWRSDVLDDWSVGSIGVALSNGVGKVSSKSVGLDDSRVESWSSGDDSRSILGIRNWRNNSSGSHSDEGKESDDGLLIGKIERYCISLVVSIYPRSAAGKTRIIYKKYFTCMLKIWFWFWRRLKSKEYSLLRMQE
jgi:hypothetical protein